MQKTNNLQDLFLLRARKSHASLTVFLMNGYQLRGQITGYDAFVVVLMTGDKQQVIYKHAISTIVPERAISLEAEGGGRLRSCHEARNPDQPNCHAAAAGGRPGVSGRVRLAELPRSLYPGAVLRLHCGRQSGGHRLSGAGGERARQSRRDCGSAARGGGEGLPRGDGGPALPE